MKTRFLPYLLLLLVSGAPSLLAQSQAPDDKYFLDWLEKWNRAFSPVNTVAVSAMLPDDFRYYWTNQTDAPHAFGELATKAEFIGAIANEEQGWQVLERKSIGNYPGEVDSYVRRSTDGQSVWLHNHQKEIYRYESLGKMKTDSSLIAACYTFQQRQGSWLPVHAFVCFYIVKKTSSLGGLYQELNITAHQGKKFRFSTAMKADMPDDESGAYLWARTNKKDGSPGFYKNTWDDQLITSKNWATYSIEGTIDEDAALLTVGAGIRVPGVAFFDDFRLEIEDSPGVWKALPLTNADLEDPAWEGKKPKGWDGLAFQFLNFSSAYTNEAPYQGKYAFMITGTPDRL